MDVVIVHERFTELGGSELVVRELARIWPESRVVVPIADPDVVHAAGLDGRVSSGRVQGLYRGGRGYAHLAPLFPLSMARADLSGADLVVTSHHAFANRVRTRPGVPVISYTHSPARWLWDPAMRRHEAGGRLGQAALGTFAASQRRGDRRAAQRLAGVLANSRAVASRVREWWGRPSIVVPPPVDTDFYTPDPAVAREDFFLLAGRLVPYKRPELAIAAAEAAGVRLIVAGDGRHRPYCESVAGRRTEFRGPVRREELRDLYRRCRALVFPGLEDFGIVPVEAQACGAPVIALGAGGALDTVVEGRTGHLVEPSGDRAVQEALVLAMARLESDRFDPVAIRANAEQFSIGDFHRRVREAVTDLLEPDFSELVG